MTHRTLLVTQTFGLLHGGGIGRYLDAVCRSVEPSRITVVVPPDPDGLHAESRTPYTVLRKDLLAPSFARPSWLFRLPWFLGAIRTQHATRVLFGQYAGWVGLGPLARLFTGTSYAIIFYGLDFLSYRTTVFRRFFLRLNIRFADHVVVISSYTHTLLKDFGVPEGKIVMAHPPMEQPVAPDVTSVKRFVNDQHLDPAHTILTVCRLVKRKGVDRVIKAMPAVIREFPDARHVIIGDGPERQALEQLAQTLRITDHITFLGRVPDHERDIAYAAARAFIMLPVATRHDVEGFGIVYVEALARGIPIIATKSAGVTDIIRNDNGIALDELADTDQVSTAIRDLIREPDRAAALGARGREFVTREFSFEPFKKTFMTLLSLPEGATRDVRVSVIIPVWNATETLSRTLHSISLQSWKNLEVIVVDDGSTDDPKAVCDRFPNVRFIRKEHAGAPAARNRGFRESTGAYVLFCDSDVMLNPRMIERMLTTLELKPDASYAYCSFRFGWRTFDLFDFDDERLKQSNFICTMSLIRRKDFPGFDESLKRLQDWDLWLTMLEQGNRGVWVPARLFSSSVGKKGISARLKTPPAEAVRIVRTKHHLD